MVLQRVIHKQLGELLIERRLITSQQLAKALAVQKERGGLIGEVLVELGYVKEEDIAQALTAQYGFPFLPLDSYEISKEVIKLIPDHLARHYLLVPIDRLGNNLTIAMSNPLNLQAIEEVEKITGCNVQVFISTSSDIKRTIEKYYQQI